MLLQAKWFSSLARILAVQLARILAITYCLLCQVEVLQKSFEELKEARARDKELFEEAKEENRKQYEEKHKAHALTMKEEMVKEAHPPPTPTPPMQ
ncbi:hypothetical protein Tco_1502644 [Tanacetum coccineum]